jgi:hypothetical protein
MRGRRVFLILAISIAAYPSPPVSPWKYIESDATAVQDEALNGHVIWLYDPSTDLCFGPDGFSVCGDTNLFRVSSLQHEESPEEKNLNIALGDPFLDSSPTPYSPSVDTSYKSSSTKAPKMSPSSWASPSSHYIHLEVIVPSYSKNSHKDTCLGRNMLGGDIIVKQCSKGMTSTTRWEYNAVEGRLGASSGAVAKGTPSCVPSFTRRNIREALLLPLLAAVAALPDGPHQMEPTSAPTRVCRSPCISAALT